MARNSAARLLALFVSAPKFVCADGFHEASVPLSPTCRRQMRGCSLVKRMPDVSVVFKTQDEVNEVSGAVFASHPRDSEHDGNG